MTAVNKVQLAHKICKTHGALSMEQMLLTYTIKNGKKYEYTRCKHCMYSYQRGKEKRLSYYKQWRKSNIEAVIKNNKDRYQENREKELAIKRKQAIQLTDGYVASLLSKGTGLASKHIPKSLIEIKRLHVLIQRKLKDRSKNDATFE